MLPRISHAISFLIAVCVVAADTLDALAAGNSIINTKGATSISTAPVVSTPVVSSNIATPPGKFSSTNTITDPTKDSSSVIVQGPLDSKSSSSTVANVAALNPSSSVSEKSADSGLSPTTSSNAVPSLVDTEKSILSLSSTVSPFSSFVKGDTIGGALTLSVDKSPSTLKTLELASSITSVVNPSSLVASGDKSTSSIGINNLESASQPSALNSITEAIKNGPSLANLILTSKLESTKTGALDVAISSQSSSVKADDTTSPLAGVDVADKSIDNVVSVLLLPKVDAANGTSSIINNDTVLPVSLAEGVESDSTNSTLRSDFLTESRMGTLDDDLSKSASLLAVLDQTTERTSDVSSKTDSSSLDPTPVIGSVRTAHLLDEITAEDDDPSSDSSSDSLGLETTLLLNASDGPAKPSLLTVLDDKATQSGDQAPPIEALLPTTSVAGTIPNATLDQITSTLVDPEFISPTSGSVLSVLSSEGRTKSLDDDFFSTEDDDFTIVVPTFPSVATMPSSNVVHTTESEIYHPSTFPAEGILPTFSAPTIHKTLPIATTVARPTEVPSLFHSIIESSSTPQTIHSVEVPTQVPRPSLQAQLSVTFTSTNPSPASEPQIQSSAKLQSSPIYSIPPTIYSSSVIQSSAADRSSIVTNHPPDPVLEPSTVIPIRLSSTTTPSQDPTLVTSSSQDPGLVNSGSQAPGLVPSSSRPKSDAPKLSTSNVLAIQSSIIALDTDPTTIKGTSRPSSFNSQSVQLLLPTDLSTRASNDDLNKASLVAQSSSTGRHDLTAVTSTMDASQSNGVTNSYQSSGPFSSTGNDGASGTAWLQPVLVTATPSSALADPDSTSIPQLHSNGPLLPPGAPKAVVAAVPFKPPSDSEAIYIAFEEGLNYDFVVRLPNSSAQIFGLLPYVLSYPIPGLSYKDFPVDRLIPQRSTDKTYMATVAKVFTPVEYRDELLKLIKDRSSILYKNPNSVQRALANVIDDDFDESSVTTAASISATSTEDDGTSEPSTNNGSLGETVTASTGSKATSTAGIAVGAAAGSIIYLGLMVLLFKKLKNSRKAPLALSDSESGRTTDSDLDFFNFHSTSDRHMSHPSTFTHLNLGSTQTQTNLMTISAPFKATNSLGWNLR